MAKLSCQQTGRVIVWNSFPGIACVGIRNFRKIGIGVADGSEDRAMHSLLRDFGVQMHSMRHADRRLLTPKQAIGFDSCSRYTEDLAQEYNLRWSVH